MVRWPSLLCVVFLVCCSAGVTGVAVGGSSTAAVTTDTVQDPPSMSPPGDFQESTFVLTAYENGSVQWTVRHIKTLNESDEAAYRDFADRFNTTEMEYYTDFKQLAAGLTTQGGRETGRQMNASNFDKRAFVAEPVYKGYLETVGVIEMSFTWSNFSKQSGQELRLGDAFSNGLRLGEQMTFKLTSSGDLRFVDASPDPDSIQGGPTLQESDSITWNGPQSFDAGEPAAVLAPESALQTTTTTTRVRTTTTPTDDPISTTTPVPTTPTGPATIDLTTTTNGDTSGNDGSLESMLPILLIVFVLGAGTGGVYYVTRRSGGDGGSDAVVVGGAAESESAATESAAGDDEQPPDDDQEPAVGEEALLSDTDRVESLLEENGGRMRQSAIVEETEWSKSKVSMLLSDMEEDDEIAKLRVGRENIISLPGQEPDAAGSPFEDEQE